MGKYFASFQLKLLTASFALLLNACGGSSNSNEPAAPEIQFVPPPSADLPDIGPLCNDETQQTTISNGSLLPDRQFPGCVTLSANTELPGDISALNAFPGVSFQRPVDMAPVPGTNYIVVVEHEGLVHVFLNDPEVQDSSVFLDLRSTIFFDGNEMGLVKLTFDPDYEDNGYFYVTYGARRGRYPECGAICSVVARFSQLDNNPLVGDANSEEPVLVLNQPLGIHNVGHLEFGPDGYLYIGVGDGGPGLDPENNAQNRTNLYGSILRIDVSQGLPYRIPADNPFVGAGNESIGVIGAGQPIREEIWAYGLRNPHRFSFDNSTGEMIAGDVGQADREELNIIEAGSNYGWRIYEGNNVGVRGDNDRSDDTLTFPIYEYNRTEGRSITAGYVYRGTEFPSLFGRYVYGDYVTGNISVIERASSGEVISNAVITNIGGFGLVTFSLIDTELYFLNLVQGSVNRLSLPDDSSSPVPERLSETGIFNFLRPLSSGDGFIPYGVNAPLWSDGTVKDRWFALPEGESIEFDENGAWQFPVGTIFVKQFAIDVDEVDDSNLLTQLETRVMVHTNRGWVGYTYRWNETQDDAVLLKEGFTQTLAIQTVNGIRAQDYYFPGTGDCVICHNASEGFVLGARTAQLNGNFNYAEGTGNQLMALDAINSFDGALLEPDQYPNFYVGLDDASGSLEQRSRSYLASNCAHCHNPDSGVPVDLDFRYRDPNVPMKEIGQAALNNLGIEGSMVIAPGSKENSTLWLRMQATDSTRMPPLATHRVDEQAVTLIGEWIDSLGLE